MESGKAIRNTPFASTWKAILLLRGKLFLKSLSNYEPSIGTKRKVEIMNFELRKYNIERIKKVLQEQLTDEVAISINGTFLYGVKSIDIAESVMYDSEPIPEENYDGGKVDYIDLTFNLESGKAVHSFCPDIQACEINFESDDLWIIHIERMEKYLKDKSFDIDFQLSALKEGGI